MADERMEHILGRLEALERRDRDHGRERGPAPPPPPPDGGPPGPPGLGAGFDEKRVVDLLVGLVTEQVDRLLDKRLPENRIDERRLAAMIAEEVDCRIAERDRKRKKKRKKSKKK